MKRHILNIFKYIILNATGTRIYGQKKISKKKKDIPWNYEKENIKKSINFDSPEGIQDNRKNTSNKTVIMIHRRNNPYLKYTLMQAKKVLSNANFILIGDETNQNLAHSLNIDFYSIADFSDDLNYGYINRSVNPEYYEKFCLDRWLIFCNFVNKMNLPGALYFDSDVLVLDDVVLKIMCNQEFDVIKQKEILGFTWPCAIYWSKKGINMFVRYIKLIYGKSDNQKIAILDKMMRRFNKRGISDMTLISDFCLEKPTVNQFVPKFREICNSSELNIKQIRYDKTVELDNERIWLNSRYQTSIGKRIEFKEGKFFCEGGRVLYLHFQGGSKSVFLRVLQHVLNKKSFIVTRDYYKKEVSFTLYSPTDMYPFLNKITDWIIRL